MPTAKPVQLQVADLVNWFRDGELVINDTFQRHSVWTASAKTYLIDTILHELPIPKIYLRTKIDRKTQKSVREVVDGQQRVRTLVEFADGKLRLTARSDDFSGETYGSLDTEVQDRFLGYTITAEQLLNADDDDVIDIFARLNTYTVGLNAAEKRHARFQTNFKFAVRKASQEFRAFFERHEVFSTRKRFRMADDVFMAEVFGVLIEGVVDGGERALDKMYSRFDDEKFTDTLHRQSLERIRRIFQFLDAELETALRGPLSKPYQLLMLIAATAHVQVGIPKGDLEVLPERPALAERQVVLDHLAKLAGALETDVVPDRYRAFVEASEGQTVRMVSRTVRFNEFLKALAK